MELKERYRLLMRLIHPDFAAAGAAPWPADAAVRVNRGVRSPLLAGAAARIRCTAGSGAREGAGGSRAAAAARHPAPGGKLRAHVDPQPHGSGDRAGGQHRAACAGPADASPRPRTPRAARAPLRDGPAGSIAHRARRAAGAGAASAARSRRCGCAGGAGARLHAGGGARRCGAPSFADGGRGAARPGRIHRRGPSTRSPPAGRPSGSRAASCVCAGTRSDRCDAAARAGCARIRCARTRCRAPRGATCRGHCGARSGVHRAQRCRPAGHEDHARGRSREPGAYPRRRPAAAHAAAAVAGKRQRRAAAAAAGGRRAHRRVGAGPCAPL